MKYFIFLCVFLMILPAQSAKRKKLEIKEETAKQLIDVFNQMEKLSLSMHGKNDPMALTQVESLKKSIQKAIRASKSESLKGQHMNRLLTTAQDSLIAAQNTTGPQKSKNIKAAFKQLVTLYESYNLNLDYKVFWCRTDRSVWLQKGSKILNPFEPKSNCGRPTK